jgi:hypothetical protein
MAATDIAQWTQQLDDRSDNPGQGRQACLQAGERSPWPRARRWSNHHVQWTESGQNHSQQLRA